MVVKCISFRRFLWLGRAARYHVGYHVVSRGAGQSRISGHVTMSSGKAKSGDGLNKLPPTTTELTWPDATCF